MSAVVSIHTVAMDAHIIKGRLEAEGIPAFLSDDQYITMDWSLSLALGGVKVMVPEAYKDSAFQIVQFTEDDKYLISNLDSDALVENAAANFVPEVSIKCPRCNGQNISKVEWMRKLSLLVLFGVHAPIAFSQRFYCCDDCSHVFREGGNGFTNFMYKLVLGLSILLALLMLFISPLSDSQGVSYLSGSSDQDMIFYLEETPADWQDDEFFEYENPMEDAAIDE